LGIFLSISVTLSQRNCPQQGSECKTLFISICKLPRHFAEKCSNCICIFATMFRLSQGFLLIWVLFATSGTLLAQINLVPNGDFEDCYGEPMNDADYTKLKYWRSAAPGFFFPSATPDYLSKEGTNKAALPESYFGKVQPYTGKRIAGLLMYNRYVPNFREYITVKLDKPIQPGHYYAYSMQVTNGLNDYYGKAGINGIGVYFSEGPPSQLIHEPLLLNTPYRTIDPVFTRYWRQFSWNITNNSDKPWHYLTIGCWIPDDSLLEFIYAGATQAQPMAYYFFDDVQLREVSSPYLPEHFALYETSPDAIDYISISKERVKLDSETKEIIPIEVLGRSVKVDAEWQSQSRIVRLKIYDDKQEDRDHISLILNGEFVLKKYRVRKKPKDIYINLQPGWNYIALHALDLGEVPPNTAHLTLIDESLRSREIDLSSTLSNTGIIKIWVEQ